MALVVKDRVKETTTTTGTGALSLAGAVTNFIAFSAALSDGDTTYYAIVDNTNDDFEVGLGTYASAGNTLTRTTVLASSNAGSAVNLSAGTKDVFVTYPADKSVYLDAAGDLVGQTIKTFALSGGTANGTTIGNSIPAAGTFTNLTASGTLSFPDNSISGDDVDGGTISNFASTGIDDNATSSKLIVQDTYTKINGTQNRSAALISTQTRSSLAFRASGTTNDFTVAIGATGDDMVFSTPASGVYAERLRIDSAGTVQFKNAIEEQQYSLTGTAIDPSNGTIQYKTLGANTTFTESLADGEYVTLMIDDGAGYTITWPTTTWVGGSAPTLETSGYNVIELWHVNGTLYGAFVGAA